MSDEQAASEAERRPSLPVIIGIWVALAVAAWAGGYLFYGYMMSTYSAEAFDSACDVNQTFNCSALNNSSWSKIFGIPLTVFALPTYLALALAGWFGYRGGPRGLASLRLLQIVSGGAVAFGLFLIGIMHFVENVYCLFCMTMDTGALVVFVLSFVALKQVAGAGRKPAWGNALGILVIVGLVGFGGMLGYKSSLQETLTAGAIAAAEKDTGSEADVTAPAKVGQASGLSERVAGAEVVSKQGNNYQIPIYSTNPRVGPDDAKVIVTEFADFQCGYCKKVFYNLKTLKEKYKDEVLFVFKYYPMNTKCNDNIKNDRHRYACDAAIAAECADQQGRFWPMHDLLFKNQHKLKVPDLRYYAGQVGLDMDAFNRCVSSPEANAELQRDIEEAKVLEITGTPRTFVNGRLLKGSVAREVIEHFIELALGHKQSGAKVQRAATGPVPSAADVKQAPPMQHITHGGADFWIDTFEASVDGQGRALSLAGEQPANLSWFKATKACEAAGKRLCTSDEWVTACQGARAVDDDKNGNFADDYVEGNQFPYADYYERGWCEDSKDRRSGSPIATGSRPRCVTATGVYDLGGNVQEWVEADSSAAQLLGGDYGAKDKAGCYRPNDTFGPGNVNKTTGFRCCADTKVANASAKTVEVKAVEGLEGKPVPSFRVKLADGGELDSASFKGKVTYLTFFASWCSPCRHEFPWLIQLQKKFGDRGFQVLSVGLDTNPRKSLGFVRKAGVDFSVGLDPESRVKGLFDITSMPTAYVIDKDGIIRKKKVGFGADTTPGEMEPFIESLL